MWLTLFGIFYTLLYLNYRSPRFYPAGAAFLSFALGWLVSSLPLHLLAVQLLAVPILTAELLSLPSGIKNPLLWLGVALNLTAALGLLKIYREISSESKKLRKKLTKSDKFTLWFPLPIWEPNVEVLEDIEYAKYPNKKGELEPLTLDIYRPKHLSNGEKLPIFIYIHGGGWTIGSKDDHGITAVCEMAKRGWLSININYRLSPRATFPEQIIDVKRAIHWAKTEGQKYGANPNICVVAGGSAGGHLAALAALTPNRPEFQPGFETADTSVQGCISLYGIFNWSDGWGFWHNRGLDKLLEKAVIKKTKTEAPEIYRMGSPSYWLELCQSPPPFMIIQGTKDTLVPVEHARHFYRLLKEKTKAPLQYLELQTAHHAFELIPTILSLPVLREMAQFCERIREI